ncbi:hypothetical protein P43SY_007791 [Pythium insidiosum]|uniref:CCHC-type domain-containing protein n=1 Tax=Pythium insidiosum TaxID=114742 RepID=A0AAD5QB81_PYTIN|nr:hypothetical protein P43SY_007791 [Pythium insidiosum]
MEKITSFMRVTKKRKAPEKSAKAAPLKPPAVVVAVAPPPAKSRPAPSPGARRPEPVEHEDEDGELYEHGVHVPAFIYHTVKYARKSDGHKVSKVTQRVVDFISEHYEIPADFETSHKFGPHSGITYETRLLRAYKLHLLSAKRGAEPEKICVSCGALGHSDRSCPDGF